MKRTTELARVEFLGLRFAVIDSERVRKWILKHMRRAHFSYLVTPNVDHAVRLNRETYLPQSIYPRQAYDDADLCVCDSRILALLASWSGIDLPVITGSDLTAQLLSTTLPEGTRIALVGGRRGPEALACWLSP